MDDKKFEKLKARGQLVKLDDNQGAYVFPVGFRHLTKFSRQVKKALAKLMEVEVPRGSSEIEVQKKIGIEAIPIILEDLMDLVEDTTVLGIIDGHGTFYQVPEESNFDDLAHWNVPLILTGWFELSFGEEKKWRPWITAAEQAIQKLTGKPISILEMFSKASSSSATAEKTSSTDTKSLTTESDSLTPAGQ